MKEDNNKKVDYLSKEQSEDFIHQYNPDFIAGLRAGRSEFEDSLEGELKSILRNSRDTHDKLKEALEDGPLTWKQIYKFMLSLDQVPVKIDGNIHAFVDGRWVHIKSPKDMIDLLRSTEATSVFEFAQFPLEHVVRLMDKGLTDSGEYDRSVIDFNNGSLNLVELEDRLDSDVSVEEFIDIVRDVFNPDVYSECIPRLSYDWDLLFDSSGCRAHSFIKETVNHPDDRHNIFFFVGNALTSSDSVKKVMSLFGQPRCLAEGTLVPLFDGGFKPVECLVPGVDRLINSNGGPVDFFLTHQGVQDTFKVSFNNGASVLVSGEHKFRCWTERDRMALNGKVRHRKNSAGDIRLYKMGRVEGFNYTVSDMFDMYSNKRVVNGKLEKKLGIVSNKMVEYDSTEPLIDPYWLGYWLGDGDSVSPHITCHVDDTDDLLANIPDKSIIVKNIGDYTLTTNHITFWKESDVVQLNGSRNHLFECLKGYNLLGNKHIPDDYLYGSVDVRLELLRGLMDSDGTVIVRNPRSFVDGCNSYTLADGSVKRRVAKGTCGYEIILKSGRLVDDILVLLRSLGIKTRKLGYKSVDLSSVGSKRMETQWYPRINFTTTLDVFKLKRKQDLVYKLDYNSNNNFVMIDSITESDCVPVYDITLLNNSSDDELFMVGEEFILTHNSGKSTVASFITNLFKSSETDLKNFTSDGQFSTLPILGNDILVFGDVDRNDIVNPAPFKKLTARDRMDVTPKHSNAAKIVSKLEMPYCILTCNDILRLKNDSIKNRFLYAKAENSLEGKPQDDYLHITLAEAVNLSYLLLKSLYVFFTGVLLPDANSRDNLIEINKDPWLYIFNSVFIFDENWESTIDDKDSTRKDEYLTTKCMRILMEHCMDGLVRNGIVVNHTPMSTKIINNIARYHFNIDRSVVGTPTRYPFTWNCDNSFNMDLEQFLEDTADENGDTYCVHCANSYGNRCFWAHEIVNLPGQDILDGD